MERLITRHRLLNLRFEEDQVMKFVVQAANGLAFAHMNDDIETVHLDLKP